MRLLVSVSNAEEAAAAAAGGADVIDAKDPLRGALGAVTAAAFDGIRRAVRQPTSAALGDAGNEADVERDAHVFHAAGASFVKIGFAGITSASRAAELLCAVDRGARGAVVAVAYADHERAGSLSPDTLIDIAARGGAAGILVDTADKDGPGLYDLFTQAQLGDWIASARQAGLFVAVAGKLRAEHLAGVRDAGADIAGVRGAACLTGRGGPICSDRVRMLHARCTAGAADGRERLSSGKRA